MIFDSAGFGEWIVLLAVVLVVVGPRRLPSAARRLGRFYARLRRVADGFRRQMLEMDSELEHAAADAARGASDAFRIEGDEASAEPALEA